MRRFRSRLVLGYATLLVVTLSLAATALVGLHVSTSRLERTGRTLTDDLLVVEHLRFHSEHLVAAGRGYLLMPSAETREKFESAAARVAQSLDSLRALGGVAAPVEVAVQHYVVLARTAVEVRAAAGGSEDLIPFLETNLVPARARLVEALQAFVDRERELFHRESGDARDFARRTQQLVILATAFSLVLAIGIAGVSMRRLNAMFASEHEATRIARRAVLSRDEVMAIVSHDLRSPLQTIGLATAAMRDGPIDPAASEGLGAIERAAARMETLIAQLLDLAALDRGVLELHRTRQPLGDLVEVAGSQLALRARAAGITLSLPSPPPGTVEVDRERILQVLSNLLDNALKHTPAGGRIEVRTEVGPRLRFEVSDTGSGIPAEQLSNVFLRYWRGSAVGRGSLGLGLYICKQIVEAHGGEIGVESTHGQGTTFWFTLPLTGDDRDRGV